MSRILGQARPLEILQTALRSGRFHHAWIFSGPRGVGKYTTAIELARILLDPDLDKAHTPIGAAPTDTPTQRLINAGTHPDLHIIRKELAIYSEERELRDRKQMNIPINLLRERVIGGKSGDTYYEAPAYRTAVRGHGKVFIIDEAELLAREAQNAMLKTLEEPPIQTYFILVTRQPERLYSTIHSRCQHVRFNHLDAAAMRQWFAQSNLSADPAVLSWVEQFAEGSPGVAKLAIEYGFYQWQQALEPMLMDLQRGKFPVALGETMAELVDAFAAAWVKAHGEKTTSKDAANKDGARHLFTLLASYARRQLAAACATDPTDSPWLRAIDLLREAERELDSNVSNKLLLENLAVQWHQTFSSVPAGT